MATLREGDLTTASLEGAVASEVSAGRRPRLLVVGSAGLEVVAVRILASSAGALVDLVASVPNVLVDLSLPEAGWELRE